MSPQIAAQARARPAPTFRPAPGGILRRKCSCGSHAPGGECESCRKRAARVEHAAISSAEASTVPPLVHEVLQSPGRPLEPETRAYFEPRFGQDFSGVRVHSDERAAISAKAVDALAYTVGDRMVFGSGLYRPATSEGRKLLAHELSHIVQQGRRTSSEIRLGDPGDRLEREADLSARSVVGSDRDARLPASGPSRSRRDHQACSLMQRTPAPPSYDGIAGVQDLSKIRIDAIEDFLASSLTAPRTVNVHVNDARVTHLTWLLYDPNDQMMPGSFSTMPGSPQATSRPFTLQPSHFSGGSFVAGTYVLRCSGLDDQHRPLVYADRDFNVLRSDLTTGTALATTYGVLTFTRYSKTDANPPANPRYSVDVELRFLPKATVSCAQVAFIQSLRTIDGEGRSQQHTANSEQDARQTPLAWSIDRVAGAPSPFYIVGRDSSGAIVDVPGWGAAGRGGASPTAASLIDRPSWNRENVAQFESCAVCRDGANSGQTYGCATWGYRATSVGRVTLMPRSFRQMPSDQFEEARAAWNTWRATRPAATRPEAAPGLRRP